MRLRLLCAVLLANLMAVLAHAGTVTGTIQRPNGQPLANGVVTFSLSQSGVTQSGAITVTSDNVYCGTSSTGTVVGVTDPAAAAVLSANYGAGTLPATRYYVEYTYTSASGESFTSPETTFLMTGSGTLNGNAPSLQPGNATGYKVYIGTTSGGETLQQTVVGFAGWSQSAALGAGTPPPLSNSTLCNTLIFNDAITPSYTTYLVNLLDSKGKQVAGYPQRFYFSGATLDLSTLAPAANLYARFPNAIVAQPGGNGLQSIAGPLSLGTNPFAAGPITASSIDNIVYVDGVKYPTIQAAITTACAASPSLPVVIPPGTYAQNTPFVLCDGINIRGSGRNDTTITTTLSSGSLFPLIDFHDVSLSDFSVVKSGTNGGTFLTCQYCQDTQVFQVNVSGISSTFTDGLFFNSDANGSSLYNDLWQVKFENVISGNCVHVTSTNAGKTVNANHLWGVKCNPNAGATEFYADSAATQTIGEWKILGGEFSGGAAGINIATNQARNIIFSGATVENNSGTGYQVASGAYKVQCFGGTIGSNGTNVTDAGTSSVMDCNVAGTSQNFSLDPSGNLAVNGIGLNGAAPTANGINFNTASNGLQVSGTTVVGLPTHLLISAALPTIAGAGCGGSAASISTNNGTAVFDINVGTAPTSGGCTVAMPAAATRWNCSVNDYTTISTGVFFQKQTASTTTSIVLQNYSDVAVATAPTANDIYHVKCGGE